MPLPASQPFPTLAAGSTGSFVAFLGMRSANMRAQDVAQTRWRGVVHRKGKARGLEEGRGSRKMGDNKLATQLCPTRAVGTIQYF